MHVQRDADTDPDRQLAAVEQERLVEGRDDPLGDPDGSPLTVGVLDQYGELVAAEPGNGVRGRMQCLSRSATSPSSTSPTAWPWVSLTPLNPSRSRKSTATVAGAAGGAQRVTDPVLEQRPVGQPGQGVVERLVGQRVLEPLALADVAGVEHVAADVAVLRPAT